jgi:phospholipid/cholesterol/gamma-HCH transport system substrate-binding protein
MTRELTRWQALVLGGIVLAVLVLGGYALMAIQERRGLGADAFTVHAGFRDIGGVEVGTRVRIQGIDAGEVTAILPPDVPGDPVTLRLRLAGKLRHLVARDAKVQIAHETMLAGKVVRILPGTTSAGPVDDDAMLAVLEGPDMLDTVAQAATRLHKLLGDADATLTAVRTGEGAAGKITHDLAQATGKLNAVLTKVDDTLARVQKGEGSLGKLIQDDRLYVELTDTLGQVKAAMGDIQSGNGTLGKLVKSNDVYAETLGSLQDMRRMVASVKQNSDAIKALPVVRSYVIDAHKELVRPDCKRSRKWFAEDQLFEPGRAVLTAAGKRRLDETAAWLSEHKDGGSEVVVAAFADAKQSADFAQTLTQKQSQAVLDYLVSQHRVQRTGFWWWSNRNVKAVGVGANPSPTPEIEALPSARIEVLVFVPEV